MTTTKKREDYYIIRTFSAGAYFAKIKKRVGKEAVLADARKICEWTEAETLLEASRYGVGKDSVITCTVDEVTVTEVVAAIRCTPLAVQRFMEHPQSKHYRGEDK